MTQLLLLGHKQYLHKCILNMFIAYPKQLGTSLYSKDLHIESVGLSNVKSTFE